MRLEALGDAAWQHVNNRYYDGAHYDRRYEDYVHDVQFWCDLAEASGRRVLELAAGTGRLSLPIAARGIDVVGLDIAQAMLSRAKSKAGADGPRFLVGDMRDFDLDQRFDLIMIACSSICHLLSDDDVLSCFASARRHLDAGGTFAMDLVLPARETAIADGQWRPRFGYLDPAGRGDVTVRGRRSYDVASRILTDELDYEFSDDGRVERATRVSRMYPFDQLCPLLERSGFAIRECHGGFGGEPLTDTSAIQVLICERAPRMAG
ncbi:class I SAM-dependent methyltransferase [Nonomuraea sp. NPDC050227]|uniref:class I SAM-dependent methyltransferase n=1 Tax=Nonomuraea sp. NPDC050227 TaxID=3364360 RepID=UPI0037976209